ncbi:MAG: GNAT family N-acetyltransferase [Candidatus Helarchaeota archaeon]
MNNEYLDFEIDVNKLKLPDHPPIPNLKIVIFDETYSPNNLIDIFVKIFPDEINSEKENEFRHSKRKKYEGTYIALINEKIIGFLITGILTFNDPLGYILYLGVLKNFRSKGIATELLKRFKLDLNKKGVSKIQARIKKDNFLVLKYINYLGFKQL